MKKNSKHSLQFAVLVVGILIAVLFFALTNSKTDAPQTNNQGFDNQKKSSSQQSEDPSQDPAVQNNSKVGTYQDYSKPTFTTTPGTRLIFFFSSQSLQSIELDKSIKSSQIPAGVTIFKADFGTEDDLRNKYGVTLQGTVVKVKEDGSLDKKFTLDDKSDYKTVETELL